MNNIISSIKKHIGVVVLTLCVGLIILLPTVLSIDKIGWSQFRGIYPVLNDDEAYYNTLTREVYDGHNSLSNPFIKEYKNGPYLFPPLPEIISVVIAKIIGVSVVTMAVVNDFFLPAISVILLYGLLFKITQSKKKSLFLTGLFFLSFIASFNRPISPQFHFIFLLAGFNLIWLIATMKNEIKKVLFYNISLSIIFGILVYAYPFYWMTLGIVYSIWTFLIALTEKDFRYWLKNWVAFFIPTVIFSVPFIVNNLHLRANPLFLETSLRMGFINTHIPGSFFNIGLMFLCVPLVYLLWKICENKKIALLGPTLITGGVILNWQNVIIGQTFQFPQHFYMVMFLFIFIIFAVLLLNISKNTLAKFPIKSKAAIFLFVIFITFVFYKQRGEMMYAYQNISFPVDMANLQKFSDTFTWLEINTSKDSAVYVLGEQINTVLPVYTHNNVYFSTDAGLSVMSDEEIENRWAIQHFFDPVNDQYVRDNQREIWANKFIETYQSKESRRKILKFITGRQYQETELVNQVYIDRVVDQYSKFQSMGFEKAIKTYSVDYIILDNSYNLYPRLVEEFKLYKFLTPIKKVGDTIIYKVN